MSRDYKHAIARKRRPEASYGSWMSFTSGLMLGLFVAVLTFLFGEDLRALVADANLTGAATAGTTGLAVADQPTPATAPEPRFDFYKILPEMEVEVPQWEIERDAAETKPAVPEIVSTYVLQVGSFQKFEDADRAKANLALAGIKANIQRVVINGQDVRYRVHVGPFTELAEVNAMRARLIQSNTDFILLRIGEPA